MIPPTPLASWLVAVNWLSICCKNKEINFFQDIGDTTSFDLELVTKDCINNDQIIMAVLQETRRKSNFFITFGCLVSADQPTINYKGRLRRKLTQTLIFPKSSLSIYLYLMVLRWRRVNMKLTNRTLSPFKCY